MIIIMVASSRIISPFVSLAEGALDPISCGKECVESLDKRGVAIEQMRDATDYARGVDPMSERSRMYA